MAAFVWSFHRKGFTICCSFTDSYTVAHTQVAAGYRARRWARLTIANYLGFINLSKEERSSWVIVAPKMTFHSMNINMKSCSYSWQTTENHDTQLQHNKCIPFMQRNPKTFPTVLFDYYLCMSLPLWDMASWIKNGGMTRRCSPSSSGVRQRDFTSKKETDYLKITKWSSELFNSCKLNIIVFFRFLVILR